jgi:hypothetical protein
MSLEDFLNSINGQPYSEDRHCWALVVEIQSRFFGRDLPMSDYVRSPRARHMAVHQSPAKALWAQSLHPAHGAVVLMSTRATSRVDCHAGVCLLMPHPVIVHTDRHFGVSIEDEPVIRARGWHPTYWIPA